MKRLFFAMLGGLIALQLVPVTAFASVNDFYIANYEMDLRLSRDTDKRSLLTTTETITAVFPQANQNHGIERAIPRSYNGHPTDISLSSVVDAKGESLPYSTHTSNDNLVVRIGKADRYVHGSMTYVISYQQRDVTRYYADTKSDEFYWDTNGTEWAVPIHALTTRLHATDELASSLTGKTACYQGAAGSNDQCQLTKQGNSFEATVRDLRPHQNMTIAVGFHESTFAAYQPSLLDRLLTVYFISLGVTGLIGLGVIIWLCVKWSRWTNRKTDIGTIVPEYLPPKNTSVTTSASILTAPRAVFTAQLLDFAVRHYIKIYETKPKSFWSKAEYDIEIVRSVDDLLAEEQEIFTDIFGTATVGKKLALKKLQNNTAVYMKMSDNDKKLKSLVRGTYALRTKDSAKRSWFKRTGVILLLAALLTLSPGLLVAALVAFICAYTLWPLTDKGVDLHRYLEGLKMYISVAETERLKMLQSPEGAQKVQLSADSPSQLVRLYERVLPYAVLFGQEKEWNKQVGAYYESAGTSPDWYAGHAVFNAAVFSSAMSSFATSVAYTSASSSSSGGSTGGGSSGGGGGGGGGGGW